MRLIIKKVNVLPDVLVGNTMYMSPGTETGLLIVHITDVGGNIILHTPLRSGLLPKGVTTVDSGPGVYVMDCSAQPAVFRLGEATGTQQVRIIACINASDQNKGIIAPPTDNTLNGAIASTVTSKPTVYIVTDSFNKQWSITGGAEDGVNGVDGRDGRDGLNGGCGVSGPQGADGSQGIMGPQGAQGPIGPQGADGFTGTGTGTGSQGATGAAGVDGPQGATGAAGVDGPQGATGAAGVDGPQGATGAAGVDGPQGASITGPQGVDGPQGASITGLQGVDGPQGVQGAQGASITGPQGAQGADGPQGSQGAQGANGTGGVYTEYIHTQSVASDVWSISHLQNAYPEVRTVDISGVRVYGNVVYNNSNNVTVTFLLPVSGIAYV